MQGEESGGGVGPERDAGPAMSLLEAIARRRSVREFAAGPLTRRQVKLLCWAAQGITGPEGERAAPSAGAIFPFTVYAVTGEGTFRFRPEGSELERHLDGDVRGALQAASLDQECVGSAPLCLVLAADVALMQRKYADRSGLYCALEAGHMAQNVLLVAAASGLGGVPVGAFEEGRVAAALKLPARLTPFYLLPIGRPLRP